MSSGPSRPTSRTWWAGKRSPGTRRSGGKRALGAQVARANGADLGLDNQGRLHGDGDLPSGDGRLAHVDVLGDAVGVRQVSGTGLATFRCDGGKLAESWWNFDDAALMLKLGVIDI